MMAGRRQLRVGLHFRLSSLHALRCCNQPVVTAHNKVVRCLCVYANLCACWLSSYTTCQVAWGFCMQMRQPPPRQFWA